MPNEPVLVSKTYAVVSDDGLMADLVESNLVLPEGAEPGIYEVVIRETVVEDYTRVITVEDRGTVYPNVAAFLGHSFIASAVDASAGLQRSIRGWPNYTSFFSRGRLRVPQSHLLGYSGADTAAVLSHLSEALALNPKPGYLFIDTGANDVTKDDVSRPSASAFLATLSNTFATIRAAGIMPVAKTISRRVISGTTPLTSAQETWRQDVNTGLRALATPEALRLIDHAELFADGSGTFDLNMTYDRVHPDGPGARALGLDGWNAISDLVYQEAPSHGTVAGNVLATPSLAGSGGAKSPNDGSIAGNVPSSWTLQTSGSIAAVTTSMVAATDGGHDWYQVELTAGAGGRGGFILFQTNAAFNTSFAVGDRITGGHDIEIEGATGAIGQFGAEIRSFGGSTPRASHLSAITFDQVLNPAGAVVDKGRLETYPWVLPSGVTGEGYYMGGTARPGQTIKVRLRDPWVVKR